MISSSFLSFFFPPSAPLVSTEHTTRVLSFPLYSHLTPYLAHGGDGGGGGGGGERSRYT